MAQKSQSTGGTETPSNAASSGPKSAAESTSQKQSGANPTSSASSVLPKMSDPVPSHGHGAASSQPMAKSGSSGSNPPSKDATAATPSPYGTRSRNRTGTSRPNYAEDIDMEGLFEMYPERREDDVKKTSRQTASASSNNNHVKEDAAAAPPAARGANGSSRKPLPSDHKAPQNGAKDPQSQSNATNSANTASHSSQPSSKKRKAASQTAGQSMQASSAESATAQAAVLKKVSSAATAAGVAPPAGPHKGYAETNLLTFEDNGSRLKDGKLAADDGTVLEVNDHVYLVCEPPGEPYYLARIMEFLHVKNDPEQAVDALKVNWYYRPKDIARKVNDTRAVFATMHSDISPLTSLRGKCTIKHKAEVKNLDEYRKSPDCFWFEKLYDRYIQKNYEVIPTFQIINVPERVKKVLDERWKYILVEQGRGKELTSAVKLCKRCSGYCASNDSVDCAVCQNTYHMNCVRPPLLKKPSRGFAWSCAACSRAQERKLEARNTPNMGQDSNAEPDEEEFLDEEEDDMPGVDTGRTSPDDGADDAHPPATDEQMYHASLWPYRYLGIHCKVEDALDYDDRIYPRAATRVGPRHQATVMDWPGRPIKFVKPAEIEIKKSGRKDGRLSKEAQAALEAERAAKAKRPKWIQDEPPGYVPRGEDYDNDDPNNTATLLWKPVDAASTSGKSPSDAKIDKYMDQAKSMAKSLGLPDRSTNLQDAARDALFRNGYDTAKALKELPKLDKGEFKEPELTPAEQKKFEEGVSKFGSELHSVKKHVKTLEPRTVVRYYYTWKKTDRGKQIWANYPGRKGKKEAKEAKKAEAASQSKMQDDVADDQDDSAFDTEKAVEKKRQFICKFCNTKHSRQWRRAPNAVGTMVTENGGKGANKDKGNQYVVALCRRCAELWRRYAVQWEDIDQLVSKLAQSGSRAWKKKVDEELLKEIGLSEQRSKNTVYGGGSNGNGSGGSNAASSLAHAASASGANQPAAPSAAATAGHEPPRKKLKTLPQERETDQAGSEAAGLSGAAASQQSKKKEKALAAAEKEKPQAPPQPVVPEWPPPKTMPCAICLQLEPLGDQHLVCRECRLTVHRNCYGVIDNRNPGKWVCDMCANDKSPHVSINYTCVLCPVEYTEHDFVEPPKTTHKKKTERDRERERLERERAVAAADHYRRRQIETNRPACPREPLKRTADNNWVHVTCAVWTPEVRFGTARALEPSEGIPSIPRARYAEVCKACKRTGGACVACHHCRVPVHVECAHQAGFLLGFDITPVKGSRRDQVNVVTINGESGSMSAAVWCKDHVPQKTIVHQMHDLVDDTGLNALQLFVQNFKKADLTLTGCARKANLITMAARMSSGASPTNTSSGNNILSSGSSNSSSTNARRTSTNLAALLNGDSHGHGSAGEAASDQEETQNAQQPGGKICLTCGSDVSPRWHPIDKSQELVLTNGYSGSLGVEAQRFVAQRTFQCHKCKKANKQPRAHTETTPPAPALDSGSSRPGSRLGPSSVPTAPIAPSPVDRIVAGPLAPPVPLNPEPASGDSLARPTPPVTSPRGSSGAEHGPRHGSFGWASTPLQAPSQVGMVSAPGPAHMPAGGPAPPIQAPPIVPPSIAPPPVPHSLPPRSGPAVPTQPPPPGTSGPAYPPSASSHYNSGSSDWHRTTHHPPPLHQQINGGPQHPAMSPITQNAIPQLVPPNLRPPPLGGMNHSSHGSAHGPPPSHSPMTNGHIVQAPMVNGVPPPRRMSGPPPPPPAVQGAAPSPYVQHPYHHQHLHHAPPPPPPQHLTNGMVPPRIDHPFSQVLNPQRSPFSSHGSPAVSRDPLSLGRDPPPPHPPPPASRPESRPASGASASPSLRNLLS